MSGHRLLDQLDRVALVRPHGIVMRTAAGHCEATGPACRIGDTCAIEVGDGAPLFAEVAGVETHRIILLPFDHHRAIPTQARVTVSAQATAVPVGDAFAGRAVDALGAPIDGGAAILGDTTAALGGSVPRPLDRAPHADVLATGVRAIDGLLTLGIGQRVGIFAASGVGKTSLVEQLVAQTPSDRTIVGLVGERGREVEAIWRMLSTRPDADRFTLVAATSDQSAVLRARSVDLALTLAEHWRDRGEHVALFVDSVTRLAMALREIGLAAGQPPTVRAYTPNVFAALPRVVERCGAVTGGGAISAVITVLSETDDVDDPIVETMKALLDGHIILSRTLADRGHFPAIDVVRSISRQAARLTSDTHGAAARAVTASLATYEESRMMIESGLYTAGANGDIDRAIAARPALTNYLRQSAAVETPFADSVDQLAALAAQVQRHA